MRLETHRGIFYRLKGREKYPGKMLAQLCVRVALDRMRYRATGL